MTGYTTTRGAPEVELRTAVFQGLAADGGLFVPTTLPRLEWPPLAVSLKDLRPVAHWAAPAFFPSISQGRLSEIVAEAFDFPVPLVPVERGIWCLELFHGPTHAFKDAGARFMASLMKRMDETARRRTILVATSGDTGGAVASAFLGVERYSVVALFPRDGISAPQRRQMTTLGGNVVPLAVGGTFDDCQRMVKEAFADRGLREGHGLTSANSINVARLLPQALYYLHAAGALSDLGERRPATFVVPSGNLGNLCAGLLAHRAGMPARRFVAASNENRGFVDFLRGGRFRARPSVTTTSSAMDVGDPSNLERIRWLYHDDDGLRREVCGEVVSESEVARCISELHAAAGYVADPHTAVAYMAAKRQDAEEAPRIVLATAHPAKFPEVVESAIGEEIPLPPGLLATRGAKEEMHQIQPRLSALRAVLDEVAS